MAERRMFAKTIVTSDEFLDMSATARCLYFTLAMFADDDGFVNNPKSIMRQTGSSNDDMDELISKKYILRFNDGIIVIKHWRIHNYLRNDRYVETKYVDLKKTLYLDENKAYTNNKKAAKYNVYGKSLEVKQAVPKTDASGIPNGRQVVYQEDTNGIPNGRQTVSTGKDSIGKDNTPLFIPPQGEKKNDFADEFFKLYPRYVKDRAKMRVDVDYKRLIEEFGKSKYLRSLYTVKQINEAYPLILNGDYRDKEKENPFAGVEAKAARERWYAERKAKAENDANKVLERFLQNEEFKRIHKRLGALPCEIGKAEYQAENGDAKAQKQLVKLTQEQNRLTMQYRGIIELNGMTEEDLLPKWHCRKCSDTGYLTDGRMCDCYEVAL